MFAVREKHFKNSFLRSDGLCGRSGRGENLPIQFFDTQEQAETARNTPEYLADGREVVQVSWVLVLCIDGKRVDDKPYYAPKRGEDPSHLEDWSAKQSRAKRFNSISEANEYIAKKLAYFDGGEAVRPMRLVKGVKDTAPADKEQKGGLITPSANIFNN